MEQAEKRLKAEIALLTTALATLTEALNLPLTPIVRDAVIQRFEYVFELSWKTIKWAADFVGAVCNSPREAIKLAFKQGWMTQPDEWLESMKARNKTSHTYNEKIAEEVYDSAKKFPVQVNELLDSLKKIM